MIYPFECPNPNCEHKEQISMPITLYSASGHMCPKCGTEMVREVKSLVCGMSIDKTGDFYSKYN